MYDADPSSSRRFNYFFNLVTYSQTQRSSILLSVSFTDSNTGTAVGDGGIILRTSNKATPVGLNSLTGLSQAPLTAMLHQNFPNPFNPTTRIDYDVAAQGTVRLAVYDVVGREMAVLVNEQKGPGSYSVDFDGSRLANGVYIYRPNTGAFTSSKSMAILN